MTTLKLDKVSDIALDKEYRKRFFLNAGDMISCVEDAARHFNVLFAEDPSREHFGVLYLNGVNKLINSEVLFVGTINTSQVHPREIIKRALEDNASAIICGHNHPSGRSYPSKDDLQITEKIRMACKAIDILLHDHVIVTGTGYYSFEDHGMMNCPPHIRKIIEEA